MVFICFDADSVVIANSQNFRSGCMQEFGSLLDGVEIIQCIVV